MPSSSNGASNQGGPTALGDATNTNAITNNRQKLLTNHFRKALRPYDVNVFKDGKQARKKTITGTIDSANGAIGGVLAKIAAHVSSIKEPPVAAAGAAPKADVVVAAATSPSIKEAPVVTLPAPAPAPPPPLALPLPLSPPPSVAPVETKIIAPKPPPPLNYIPPPGIPDEVEDIDRALLGDFKFEPHYAWDSFIYDREQEIIHRTEKYLSEQYQNSKFGNQKHLITPGKRAEFVDWLGSMQNIFALDHEPLYTAVKLADQYLMRKICTENQLPLLYLTSLFIAAKFEERLPPIEMGDLIVHAKRRFFIKYRFHHIRCFEGEMLTTLEFQLRYPLSYGFLRRFAQCTRSDRKTLTLARYILESSLLDYEMIDVPESKTAASALLLAFKMLNTQGKAWTKMAVFYTGYEEKELLPISHRLNELISHLDNTEVKFKYSNKIFFQVALIPPLPAA